MLKDYHSVQAEKVPEPPKPIPTGIACPDKESIRKCNGELEYNMPKQKHPQLKELKRATCDLCGWFGWV